MQQRRDSNDYHYLEGRLGNRARLRAVKRVLDEWYGSARADEEISVHQPSAVHISQPVERLLNNAFNPRELLLLDLKRKWPSLVGHSIGGASRPVKLKNGVLFVEVDSSARLMEIKTRQRDIKIKVDQLCGPDFCARLAFVAAGSGPRQGV